MPASVNCRLVSGIHATGYTTVPSFLDGHFYVVASVLVPTVSVSEPVTDWLLLANLVKPNSDVLLEWNSDMRNGLFP